MLKQYLLIAFRIMWRNKTFAFINLLSLSTGITFCLLIFTFIEKETSHDRFHANSDRIYRVVNHYSDLEGGTEKSALQDHKFVEIFTESIPSLVRAAAFQKAGAWIRRDDRIFKEDLAFADSVFLEIFKFPALAGDPKTALYDPQSVVIVREVADRFFDVEDGNYQAILGEMLTLPKGEERLFKVTAVLETLPKNSSLQFTVLIPYKNNEPYPESNNFFGNCSVYIELESAEDVYGASEAANSLVEIHLAEKFEMARRFFEGDEELFFEFILQPLKDIYLNEEIWNPYEEQGNIKYAYVLSSIAVLVLLVSCINYIMLTTGRTIQRLKEVGMRKVLGGTTRHVINQFLSEAFLNSILSLLFAIVLSGLFLPVFNQLSERELTLFLLDKDMILFILVLILVISFLIGLAPAININRMNPQDIFHSRIKYKGGKYSSLFVIAQYTMTIGLIISTFIIIRQLNFLREKETGFNRDHVVVLSLPDDFSSNEINRLRQTLVSRANITNVTGSDRSFVSGSSSNIMKREDDQTIIVRFLRIDPDYIDFRYITD